MQNRINKIIKKKSIITVGDFTVSLFVCRRLRRPKINETDLKSSFSILISCIEILSSCIYIYLSSLYISKYTSFFINIQCVLIKMSIVYFLRYRVYIHTHIFHKSSMCAYIKCEFSICWVPIFFTSTHWTLQNWQCTWPKSMTQLTQNLC